MLDNTVVISLFLRKIIIILKNIIVPTIENEEKIRACTIFFSTFLFSKQNQVLQIIIGQGRVIYHIEALCDSNDIKKFFCVEKNRL